MKIYFDKDIRRLTTLGANVRAQRLIILESYDEVQDVVNLLNLKPDETWMILGFGSNVLFIKDYEGTIVHIQCESHIEILERTHDIVSKDAETQTLASLEISEVEAYAPTSLQVQISANTSWAYFVAYCMRNDLVGLENLASIPGSVGGAVIQNIGAYGREQNENFVNVKATHLKTGETKIFEKNECDFGYRASIFKNDSSWLIISATYELQKNNALYNPLVTYESLSRYLHEYDIINPNAHDVYNAIVAIRASKLPAPELLGNAGSFFKNPYITPEQANFIRAIDEQAPLRLQDDKWRIPASWLIEQAGWKGKRVGVVGMHDQQALVLVNYGGATGRALFEHALRVQKDVQDKFHILIEPEVTIII